MQTGFRRSAAIATSVLGAIFVVVYVLASWALLHTTNTDTYVQTTAIVIDQPQVQDEIATTIVSSVVGQSLLPDEVVTLLTNGARLIVASDSFHAFWELANRSMHDIVRDQLLGNSPINPEGARIDITAEVNLVVENLRQIDPRVSALLPNNAPETAVQIVDQDTLTKIRDAIGGLERLKTFSVLFACVFFVISTILLGLRRRSLVMASLAITITAPAIYGVSKLIPLIAERFIDEEFRGTTYVVATQMASTMTTNAWQVLFFGFVGFVVAFFPRRNTPDTPQ
jgi:hypothetical protein